MLSSQRVQSVRRMIPCHKSKTLIGRKRHRTIVVGAASSGQKVLSFEFVHEFDRRIGTVLHIHQPQLRITLTSPSVDQRREAWCNARRNKNHTFAEWHGTKFGLVTRGAVATDQSRCCRFAKRRLAHKQFVDFGLPCRV